MRTQLTQLINKEEYITDFMDNFFQREEITIEVATKNNNSLRLTLHKEEIVEGVFNYKTSLTREELMELYDAYTFSIEETERTWEIDDSFTASFSIHSQGTIFVCCAYDIWHKSGLAKCESIESNQVVIL